MVSPDGGNNVYAIGSQDEAIAEFARNADGSLTEIGCIADMSDSGNSSCTNSAATGLVDPVSIAISPDGQNVYVAARDNTGDGSIAEFTRNPADGSLTPIPNHDCIDEHEDAELPCDDTNGYGIAQPTALAVSPDGNTVYAADAGGEDIAWFARAADGSLSQAAPNQCIEDSSVESDECPLVSASGLGSVDAVSVSPDGNTVYAGSEANDSGPGTISWLTRANDGSLTSGDCIEEEADASAVCDTTTGRGIDHVTSVAVSPDGLNVYAASTGASGDVAEFAVGEAGSLMELEGNDCIQETTDSGECDNTQGTGLDGALWSGSARTETTYTSPVRRTIAVMRPWRSSLAAR